VTRSATTQSSSPASTASAGATLSDLIVRSLTRHSSSEAFVAGDRRLTYAQVRDLVSQYMGALSRRGVGLGVGVTMLSPNMPESWIVQAATYLLGGRFTGLQALASVQDHIVVCEDAEAAVLVVSAPLEEHGRQVLDQVDSLRHLLVVPTDGGLPEGESYAARALDTGPATESDVAWLQYTAFVQVCAARQNRQGDQQGTRSYPRRRSAVSIATSTREVMPGTSTGRRPAT
jgi:fatty-acyl-CoA synthase